MFDIGFTELLLVGLVALLVLQVIQIIHTLLKEVIQ